MSRNFTPYEHHEADKRLELSKHALVQNNVATGEKIVLYDPDSPAAKRFPNLHFLFHEGLTEIVNEFGGEAANVLAKTESDLAKIVERYDSGGSNDGLDETLVLWYEGRLDPNFYYAEYNNELLREHLVNLIREDAKKKPSGPQSGKWSLVNYFDVWGNADDGWTVNDQCVEFDDLVVDDEASEKEVLDYLKTIGFLTTSDRRRVRTEEIAPDLIEVYEVKGRRPICGLYRNP